MKNLGHQFLISAATGIRSTMVLFASQTSSAQSFDASDGRFLSFISSYVTVLVVFSQDMQLKLRYLLAQVEHY